VRDVLGVSARPIANTDVLLFGEQDMPEEDVPEGVLHPRRIAEGVIHGVEDYGNKMGIPTVGGAIFYDPRYTANPLVFCGCVGLIPRGTHRTQAHEGDLIVVIGGRTGRDGLRGATFSSMEMDTSTSEIASISVQIGHPIQEKQVQEVILRTRDEDLYTAITDCGAGGLSSAVGEMGKDLGAQVELTTVPLKYPGLRPWEIWLSEAQERMVIAVPPAHWARVQQIAAGQDVEAVCIGTYTATGRLDLAYDGKSVGSLQMDFLHDGIPTRHLKAVWNPPAAPAPVLPDDGLDLGFRKTLLALLAHPNIRSKEAVIRRYDHEVQGGTVVKPLVGTKAHGPGDGSVVVPLDTKHTSRKGFALGHGLCPQYTELDPYAMAWAAVDEAFRNVVAVGADPDQVAILDNFCWGNPNLPDRLGSLVLASKGCHDAAIAFGSPFISGKDSLNNEYTDSDGTRHAIPGTLLISAIATVPDVTKTVTMDLKQAGNRLIWLRESNGTLGGSHYNRVQELTGGPVPQPNPNSLNIMRALYKAIQAGLVQACHDVSEGGIAVAIAEMCIAGSLGAFCLGHFQDNREDFFKEMQGSFIVEVKPDDVDAFRQIFIDQMGLSLDEAANMVFEIGRVTETLSLIDDLSRTEISLADLERAFRGDLIDAEPLPIQKPKPKAAPARRAPVTQLASPKALILHANGTNRDRDAALACEVAGAVPEIVHMNQLAHGERRIGDYDMLIVPGGFSYGDDLGAGMLWALDLRQRFREDLQTFVQAGKPVLGICNGFQTLVKAGLLPTSDFASGPDRRVTLTNNEVGHFECRPVYLQPQANSVSLFTEGLSDLILCPVAHGEGRVMARDEAMMSDLMAEGLVPLTYVNGNGETVAYPGNPNGSPLNIAALCNVAGNVMGLMPHPEDHIFPWQHPRYHRGERGQLGLVIFQNAVKYA
jgi:phosphoribosylformylglycinamidine synthase II/phosphoribosylformylglycinamidine synthase I